MKNKRLTIYVIVTMLIMVLTTSCAIDRKCPAYTQANADTEEASA